MPWPITKFSRIKNDKWSSIHKENMELVLQFDQLFIVSNATMLESFKLKNFKKGFIKQNILILLYLEEEKFHKIKIKFSCDDAAIDNLLALLEMNFKIQKYETVDKEEDCTKTVNFTELLREEIQRQVTSTNIGSLFPEDFPLDQFIKTCILDPEFPKFVDAIENIIKQDKQ